MTRLKYIEDLLQDLRYGLRALARTPGFAVVAVLTFAFCIGANTAMFSFVDAVLLKPLPYPHPDRIVMLWEKSPNGQLSPVSIPDFLDWKRQSTVFEAIAAETWGSKTLTDEGAPIQLRYDSVSPNYFEVTGAKPLLGRTFAADEDQPGKQYEVILTHRIWGSFFGADPKIVGRTLRLDGVSYTVIGVMTAEPFDRERIELWTPLSLSAKDSRRDFRWLNCWALLRSGVSLQQARQQLQSIAKLIARGYPRSNRAWSAPDANVWFASFSARTFCLPSLEL